MRGFFKLVALVFFVSVLPVSSAWSLDRCTREDIVRRVCQADAFHQDDTGVGKRFSDLTDNRTLLSARGTEVSREAYARLQRVVAHVIAAYESWVDRLPESDQLWHRLRLSTFQLPPREALGASKGLAFLAGPNANYDWGNDTIKVTPIILNYPDLSDVELAGIVAHEMGHYLDPEAFGMDQIPFRFSIRADLISAEMNRCFHADFPGRLLGWGPTYEDYADWLASQIMPALVDELSPGAAPAARSGRARNVAYVFCGATGAWGKALDELKDAAAFSDPHSLGADRIALFMSDPTLLEAIGCEPVPAHCAF